MEDESPEAHPDSASEALLDFEPVARKCKRRGGWTAENQRGFIRMLAETGSADLAAQSLGLTGRGAYELCKSAGSEGFAAAWGAALALHAKRSGRASARARRAGPPLAPEPSEAEKAKEEDEWLDRIITRYWLKLKGEREARLEGRIAAADYYVRQLTFIELVLDLGGRSLELLRRSLGRLAISFSRRPHPLNLRP